MSQCRVGETHRPPVGHRSHMSVRAHVGEKWRSTADSRGRRRLDAAGLHRRKVWQTGGLRSRAVGCGHGEMALWTLEKPPFGAIFHHFFDGFLRVFLRACPSGRELARMRPRKALVLNRAASRTMNQHQARSSTVLDIAVPNPLAGLVVAFWIVLSS